MKQSRKLSLLESATQLVVGVIISVSVTHYMMGFSVADSVKWTALFAVLSFIRLFVIRRLFNHLTI